MAPSTVHLPNGQRLVVTPIFGGVSFKSTDLDNHRSAFPPGWTLMLNEEDDHDESQKENADNPGSWDFDQPYAQRKQHIHRYKRPSLQNDHMYIASISNPSSADFKPPASATRQVAMMLWASLYWYFHQPEPDPRVTTKASAKTADPGKPKADWLVNINREGIFKTKNMLLKLERMGLITTADSSVGPDPDEKHVSGFSKTFVSRRSFWQMDARTYLFTLSPAMNSPFPAGSPMTSRPSSPSRLGSHSPPIDSHDISRGPMTPIQTPGGPFQSSSHLPTYFPPHPAQYTFSNGTPHPIRPKPYRQGETIYTRYIPSLGQYLSFRVATISPKGCARHGPWSGQNGLGLAGDRSPRTSIQDLIAPMMGASLQNDNDVDLLHKWMNDPRVAYAWGETGPRVHQEKFLTQALKSRHSFPVIGCWDGKPFGYFEIYWVKEDILGSYVGRDVRDWDRGIHGLVGEQEYRGPHRVKIWLSALIHYCWLSDMRTSTVFMEPRVDNDK